MRNEPGRDFHRALVRLRADSRTEAIYWQLVNAKVAAVKLFPAVTAIGLVCRSEGLQSRVLLEPGATATASTV